MRSSESYGLLISYKKSPPLTRPFTFLIRCLLSAYFPGKKKMTLIWVIPPLDPAIPNNAMTLALAGSASTFVFYSKLRFIFILIKKQIFTIDLKNKIDLNMTKKYKKISIRT